MTLLLEQAWSGTLATAAAGKGLGEGLVNSACPAAPGLGKVAWDITTGATGYATLTALLAGFALTGVVWMATSGGSRSRRPVVGIWASILPLVVATLLYVEVSAEQSCDRQVVEIPVPSLLLVIGAVSLFYFLSELVTEAVGESVEIVGVAMTFAVVALGGFGVFAGNVSLLRAHYREGEAPAEIWLSQFALLLAGTALAWRVGPKVVGRLLRRSKASATRWRQIAPLTIIALSAVGYTTTYVIAFLNYPGWAPVMLSWVRVVLWVVFAASLLGSSAAEIEAAP